MYVAEVTERSGRRPYRIAGLWGGAEGSLLLWAWCSSAVGLVALVGLARRRSHLLRAAGVVVSLTVYPGATHSFIEAVSIAKVADRAIGDGARWLRETLGIASPQR